MNDADRDGRRQRLGIILAVAAVVVFAGVTISIVGNRRVDSAVADIRERAQSTTIDPSTIALQSYDSSDHSLADALAVDPTGVILRQDQAGQWCVTVAVSDLLSSRSVHFRLDDDAALSEIDHC